MPPVRSIIESWTALSSATFSPTDLKNTVERWPLIDAPKAVSKATFSFAEYSKCSGRWASGMARMASAISGVGEPG